MSESLSSLFTRRVIRSLFCFLNKAKKVRYKFLSSVFSFLFKMKQSPLLKIALVFEKVKSAIRSFWSSRSFKRATRANRKGRREERVKEQKSEFLALISFKHQDLGHQGIFPLL